MSDRITEPQEWIDGLIFKYSPTANDVDVALQNMGLEIEKLKAELAEVKRLEAEINKIKIKFRNAEETIRMLNTRGKTYICTKSHEELGIKDGDE